MTRSDESLKGVRHACLLL
jgi:hypothetical protein